MKRKGKETNSMVLEKLICFPFILFLLSVLILSPGADGSFNFFVDKEEFHRITGGTLSQVYLVRDGVVNDYALGYIMTIPFHIHYLDFKWQALSKARPVHYEMLIEFSDFFALLQPSPNISKVGRLPHKLETFRVTLPCSGRLTTEVPVTLRFTFHVKHKSPTHSHTHHNVTEVNVKRNKICLLKNDHGLVDNQNPVNPNTNKDKPPNNKNSNKGSGGESEQVAVNHSEKKEKVKVNHGQILSPTLINATITELGPPPGKIADPTPPSLLLAGLLGACAVTASVVSIVFFIYLKRRLNKRDEFVGGSGHFAAESGSGSSSTGYGSGSETMKKSCNGINKWNAEPLLGPPPPLPSGNGFLGMAPSTPRIGSDVSPYAYAQIVRPSPHLSWRHPHYGHGHGHGHHGHMNNRHAHIYANQMANGGSGSGGGGDYENFGGASLASNYSVTGSVIQVDGFQVAKNLQRSGGVVERFL